MVTDRFKPRTERFDGAQRGQMLLIGALLIAVTIVALALVINTVLYTANIGSGQEANQINEVNEFTHEVSRNARSLMLRANHVERNRSIADLQTDVNHSIVGYSSGLARSFAIEGTVYTNVSYRGAAETGTRIVQSRDRNFSEPGDPTDGNWEVVPGPTGTAVGWFLLNVNVQDTSTVNTTISVDDGSNRLTYTINQSDNTNVSVVVEDRTGAVLDETTCRSVGGRTLLDLYGGSSPTGECTFTGIETNLGPSTVEIDNGTEITGQYAIVTNRTWSTSWSMPWGAYDACKTDPLAQTCITPAVWKGVVDLTYRSDGVQLGQQRNVSVYGGSS
ncbi:DUF7261 family protein [Halorhabdus salina]|uniref:DUF7261 family protein n=1 Tax=Halorhabdus salina TaxID=2750670 RepID=UPI0015EF632A|nr:hypothetical protein [Halorhabdus salina]